MPELSFEEAMKRIEQIVAALEKGDLPLDKSIDEFEEAVTLARLCQSKLRSAQARIAKLVKTEDDDFKIVPFEETGQE
jgi:exodeoxyribonuclease VII small subunit